jgi:hypothetical protein
MATVELDDLLSNEQAAAILGVKPNTLEIWRCKGKGPAFIKLGEHPSSPIRYQRSRVMAWIEAHLHASTSSYTVAARASA